MKKFEKSTQHIIKTPKDKQTNSIFGGLNLLKFLPQILQIIPKLGLNLPFGQKPPQKPQFPQTPNQKAVQNQIYAIKKMQEHQLTVQKLNKKKPD